MIINFSGYPQVYIIYWRFHCTLTSHCHQVLTFVSQYLFDNLRNTGSWDTRCSASGFRFSL